MILHRDSLGSVQEIEPGAVNWMTAGCGIVHSERSPAWARSQETRLHGIQTWVALPEAYEETDPWFKHHPAATLPTWTESGAQIKLIAGDVGDASSPVKTFSPMLYLDVQLEAGGEFTVPTTVAERAVYGVTPGLRVAGEPFPQHRLAVLAADAPVAIAADQPARCIIVGGDSVGPRIKWWNFVSSRQARINQAKEDWRRDRFPKVPGETAWIPLPEESSV